VTLLYSSPERSEMDTTQLGLLFGWAALLSAAATIVTLVTAILFFTAGERFGKINDAVSVLQMLFMLPVALVLYLLHPGGTNVLAMLAVAVGGTGMIATAVLQALLVLGFVEYEQTITAVLSAGGLVGLWLILTNATALSGDVLPVALITFGIVAGAGYILAAVGFYRGGQNHPLFYVGGLLIVVGYSVWATWLGRLLQTGSLEL
jgi:hypothetical protein